MRTRTSTSARSPQQYLSFQLLPGAARCRRISLVITFLGRLLQMRDIIFAVLRLSWAISFSCFASDTLFSLRLFTIDIDGASDRYLRAGIVSRRMRACLHRRAGARVAAPSPSFGRGISASGIICAARWASISMGAMPLKFLDAGLLGLLSLKGLALISGFCFRTRYYRSRAEYFRHRLPWSPSPFSRQAFMTI